MQKTEYNARLQDIQEATVAFGMETRVRAERRDDGHITRAVFEVYFDGAWRTIASETPFVGEENDGSVDDDAWMYILHSAARDVAH